VREGGREGGIFQFYHDGNKLLFDEMIVDACQYEYKELPNILIL
jgi:hypothetical protein